MSTFMLNRELSMTFPEGFRYDYTAQGIAMEGETVIVLIGFLIVFTFVVLEIVQSGLAGW